tara:strand:+ start:4228 stop:6546 length:2319 start_codon:yes stop_codon:yes gene_type:complete
MRILAVSVAVLALVVSVTCDAVGECAADHDGAAAAAVTAELDAMDSALANAISSLRALESVVDTQRLKIQTMRALVKTPGAMFHESTATAERSTNALRQRSETGNRLTHNEREWYREVQPYAAQFDAYDDSSDSSNGVMPISYRTRADRGGARAGPAVAKRLHDWSDHLKLTGAARLENGKQPTALVCLPQRSDASNEFPRYYAVGDSDGGVRILKSDGDTAIVLPLHVDEGGDAGIDHRSGSTDESIDSSKQVIAIAASFQRRNETILLTGRFDGSVVFHQIFETDPDYENGDGDTTFAFDRTLAGTIFASYTSLWSITQKDSIGLANPAKIAGYEKEKSGVRKKLSLKGDVDAGDMDDTDEMRTVVGIQYKQGTHAGDTFQSSVNTHTQITAVHAFRLTDGKRHYAVADASGKIVVFTGRGASIHSVYYLNKGTYGENTEHVVAFKPSRRAVTFITQTGAGSIDPSTFVLRRCKCSNLESSAMKSVAFDNAQSSKFYALAASGETIVGAVGGLDVGVGANTKATCVIRHKATGVAKDSTHEELNKNIPSASFASTKGFAFLGTGSKVVVLNVTGVSHLGQSNTKKKSKKIVPREIIVADVVELSHAFGGGKETEEALSNALGNLNALSEDDEDDANAFSNHQNTHSPVITTDVRNRFIAIGLPGGFVAMYDSSLMVWKPEPVDTKLWSQPLFVVAMIGVSVWQFYRQKGSSGRRFANAGGGGDLSNYGLDPDTLARFDKITNRAMGKQSGGTNFDPKQFRKEMEKDGRWK